MDERKTSRELRSVLLNLRVKSSLIAQLEEMRAQRRPIPTRSALVVQLLEGALSLPPEQLEALLRAGSDETDGTLKRD